MKGLYYRRKIALALVEAFDGNLSGTKFQKLLFLITQQQEEKAYNFLPYKYGCFSFVSFDDKGALISKGLLEKNDKSWVLSKRRGYLDQLTVNDRNLILSIKKRFGNLSQKELLHHVYTTYPYFAIRSEIAKEVLTVRELGFIEESKPKGKENALYTIGYEGKNIEQYINELIQSDVKLLCDVRKNPLSRKFGFSKSQLSEYLKKFDILYIHMPDLGIDSDKRKFLGETVTYGQLFREYTKNTLPHRRESLNSLLELLKKYKRVAITCFEADPNCCHRSCVANEMKKVIPENYVVKDL